MWLKVMPFRKSMLALLALVIIAFAPLLQQLHLSTCHCNLCQCVAHNINLAEYNLKMGFCLKNLPQRAPVKAPAQHDSDECPICKMYASISSGFNIPYLSGELFTEIVLLERMEHIGIIINSGAHIEHSSRAPPSC